MACAWRGVVLVFDPSIYSAGPGLGEPLTLGRRRGEKREHNKGGTLKFAGSINS